MLRAVGVLAGVGVAAWLVWEIGPAILAAQLRALSWRVVIVMLPQAAVSLLHAAGWRCAFPRRLPGVRPLVGIRLAGEAVNDTTPTGSLGGDALKAVLVARALPAVTLEEGVVSVVVAKTALAGSQAAFVLGGLGLAWSTLEAKPALLALLALLAALAGGAAAMFLWAQLQGLFRIGGRALGWLGLGGRATGAATRLDADIRGIYRDRPDRIAASWLLHLGGWVAGVVESWLILALLGTPVSWTVAAVLEGGAVGVRTAGFLVPAGIGVQEGGLVGLCALLGLPPATGLAFAAVRRIREAAYILLGYACLAGGWGLRVATDPRA